MPPQKTHLAPFGGCVHGGPVGGRKKKINGISNCWRTIFSFQRLVVEYIHVSYLLWIVIRETKANPLNTCKYYDNTNTIMNN